MLVRITSGYFCAGVEPHTDFCAPIIWYMRDWSIERIIEYCQKKGWAYELLDDRR